MRARFFYGWVIVAVTFVTMAIGVNARTAFSLFFPSIVDEFQWERGLTAGAFSFGFIVSAVFSPLIGRMMDRFGPRIVMETGVLLMAAGLLLAPLTTQIWHLYLTMGLLVGGGSVCLSYTGQSLYLPNWFVRKRGLAMGLAFAGVGIGSIIMFPWIGYVIAHAGWRSASTALGIVMLVVLVMGTLMYVVEGPQHGFTSIPVAIYWAISTMATVGFGDLVPKTDLGRAIASVMMLLGWGVLAVPTGIVTAEMARRGPNDEAVPVAQRGVLAMTAPESVPAVPAKRVTPSARRRALAQHRRGGR